jgi:hypothetical protein
MRKGVKKTYWAAPAFTKSTRRNSKRRTPYPAPRRDPSRASIAANMIRYSQDPTHKFKGDLASLPNVILTPPNFSKNKAK